VLSALSYFYALFNNNPITYLLETPAKGIFKQMGKKYLKGRRKKEVFL